ncbi:MAG: IS66 family transposase [Vicinamibacteria bacterium]
MTPQEELDRLRADLARVTAERDAALAAKAKLEVKVSRLEHAVDELVRKLYGRSSEKVDPAQLLLEFAKEASEQELPAPPHADEAPDGETAEEEQEKKAKKRKGHGWRKPPKDLRRERVELSPDPADLKCGCCGGERKSIGSPEVTERFDYTPASVFVREIVRHRYRCPTCQDGTVVAPLPPPPLASTLESQSDRGRAEAGLLAAVVTAKFNDHLPLHRQESILSREGVSLSRSTLADYVHGTAQLLRPIAAAVWREVLSGAVIGLDETSVLVVFDRKEPKNGTRKARIWVYRGRPGEVYFAITETKAKADEGGPLILLEGFHGFVQADAAAAFDDLFTSGERLEVGCNAHARRKFFEARKSSPKEAAFALATYKKVYEIEARVRDASPEERLRVRQAETKPLLAAFDAWLDELAASSALVPGTPLATAVGYARNHRVAQRRFLDDPRLSPDNNAVERALRLVAVGRKNWLFAGSEQAAYDAATLYTLVASCRELGIEPWEYLHDAIKRRAADPDAPVPALTPRAWWEAKRRAAEVAEAVSAI